jgi:DNA-binding NtrC family response regulator
VIALRARCAGEPGLAALVGASEPMARLRGAIQRVALSDRPVLVTGPTGSGKELVVGAIHALGAHPEEPLLDLNCGAIPEALIESQLFGHERGAFTGADRRQEGYFTAVRQGTLFLDEIAELPLSLQAKLLRVLEAGRFRPVGSTTEQRFTGRIVAATHADLEARVARGSFREDLFYRLNVLAVRIPPLEERRADIPALVAHFAGQQRRPLRFSEEAIAALCRTSWPGNVRQLRNLIDRLTVFAEDDLITPEALREPLQAGRSPSPTQGSLKDIAKAILRMPFPNKLEAIEEALIAEAMSLGGDNKSAAARLLGVHRKVVERRLDKREGVEEPPES